MTGNGKMSQHEYSELKALLRRREQVAKTRAKRRSAELLADVEAQLAAEYKVDDERWADINRAALAAVQQADAAIAERCRELGIREEFRPKLSLSWHSRGENALKDRRAELRKVAQTKIAAIEAQAIAEIERQSVEVQTQLVAGGLGSASAVAFLESMPGPDTLMPALTVGELKAQRALLSPERPSWQTWSPPSGDDD